MAEWVDVYKRQAISSLSPVLYGFDYVTAIAIVVTVLLAAIFVGCLIRAKD